MYVLRIINAVLLSQYYYYSVFCLHWSVLVNTDGFCYSYIAINTVNPFFLTLLYVSDMETHQNLKSINFAEKR